MNEKAIERLVKMYNEIENDLLLEIASHFSINEEFLNSDYWRMTKLEEMGLFNRNIIRYIAKKTKKTNKEILKALNKIGIDTINIEKYNKLYSNGTIKVEPSILKNNYTIQNIINKTYNELSNEFIELSNKIEQGARKAYLNIVESAYLKTSMGTHSYQQAIRQSIDELSNKGIETLTYVLTDENNLPKGIRNYTVEGAARREILTSTRKLSNAINLEVANQLDCEYLYLSEHLRCRPTHFDWQGTIIKREDLVKVTHYGDVAGLGGPNCSHYVEPYFGDARGNDLKKFSKDECEKAYNLSQYQRYLERGIRKWKRKEEMFKASDDNVAYIKSHNKRLEWQKRIQDFTNENKLKRDFTREYVKTTNNPKTLPSENTFLKNKLGFQDEDIGLTFIPKNAIITNVKIIAGKNTRTLFRNAQKYVNKYGGTLGDYSKMVGKIESEKYIFDVHFVKKTNGEEYDFKIKNRRRK